MTAATNVVCLEPPGQYAQFLYGCGRKQHHPPPPPTAMKIGSYGSILPYNKVNWRKRHTILAYYNNKPDYVNLLTDSWGLPDASPYSFWRQSNIANFVLIILCGDWGRFATAFNYVVTITRGVINHRVTASCMSSRYAEINNTSLLSDVHIVHTQTQSNTRTLYWWQVQFITGLNNPFLNNAKFSPFSPHRLKKKVKHSYLFWENLNLIKCMTGSVY